MRIYRSSRRCIFEVILGLHPQPDDTLLHSSETKSPKSRLDAFDMWIYRRVSKISWTDKITNEKVLRTMGTGREMVRQFKTRKLQLVGHLIGSYREIAIAIESEAGDSLT